MKAILIALVAIVIGQVSFAAEPWEDAVRKFDEDYWQKTFNECDLKTLSTMLASDVEFVHDQIGVTKGKENMIALTKKGVCGIPGLKLRREAVSGTVHFSPLRDIRAGRDHIYGAVVSGEHQFYESENGGPEVLRSRAEFFHVLLLRDDRWVLSRAISYAHSDVEATKN